MRNAGGVHGAIVLVERAPEGVRVTQISSHTKVIHPVEGFSNIRAGETMDLMSNPDRLTGLDASFLALEKDGAHMHVGSVLVFEGPAPDYDAFAARIAGGLHLVPRYRQRLAFPPLGASRPVWVDDPHFNVGYHVRHTALPAPAGEDELRRLAGRVFSQQLDREKPLWEIWLVDEVADDRFALICKTHGHALVDGISGVDIMTVLFDLDPDPPEGEPAPAWGRTAVPGACGAARLGGG